MPKTNVEFWSEKFERNVGRDRRTRESLLARGWKVCILWECETKDAHYVSQYLLNALDQR